MIKTPSVSVSLNIMEDVEGEILLGLIKILNLTDTTPLMQPDERNNHGLCSETK